MPALLDRRLVVVTGKGGVGKTTIAAALGMLAAARGARTIIVEVGDHGRLPELFGRAARRGGAEQQLDDGLWSVTMDPDRVLLEWVQELGGRIPGKVLASSGTFQYFAAAAPGARELFTMVKVWELAQAKRWQRRAQGYDLVVLDAPATGHALGLLRSPHTFGAIARVGPIAKQSQRVAELVEDAELTGYVGVTLPSDMAVTETIELQDGLREQLGRSLDLVVVNGLLPRRFTAGEVEKIAALDGGGRGGQAEVRQAAAHAAISVHERGRAQHNQVTRLRRRGFEVAPVGFAWRAAMDREAVEGIVRQLERRHT